MKFTLRLTATHRGVLARRVRALTESRGFTVIVMSAILGNAALLGIETYSGFAERWHAELNALESGFLTFFTAEVALRILANADRPRNFLRNPWNVFDAVVVLCAFLPLLGDNTTLLRLLRLFRVLRTARFLPQLRVIVTALGKSAPGTISFLVVGTLLLYVYAMVGWLCFATADPAQYGSIGRAALTLFILMTLDGLGEAVRAGLDISPWSFAYYASYVLLSSFLLVNLLIGVVINSLDQARDSEDEQNRIEGKPLDPAAGHGPDEVLTPDAAGIQNRIAAARLALDDAERLVLETLPRQQARDAPTRR